MDNQLLYWIWLTQRKGLGAVGLRQLLDDFGSPAAIWAADEEALARAAVLPAARETLLDKALGPAEAVMQRCGERGIRLLHLSSESYPAALRHTPDAPILL